MITLGVDAHKASHTIVAVDHSGKKLATKVFVATPEGHVEVLKWVSQWPQRTWAIEDCRALSRGIEQDLLRAGEAVQRVPPHLMAIHRRSVRTPGKSDPIDALAVAHARQREDDLPVAVLSGPEREVRLLVDHREDLVAERTRIKNRFYLHVHELEPGLAINNDHFRSKRRMEALGLKLKEHSGIVADIALELLGRIAELTQRVNQLEREIASRVQVLAPRLLELTGCGTLIAAKIIAEVASVSRFKSRDAFAMHNGTAPIPVWSSNNPRFRLSRGGNRKLNSAIHQIAITQLRMFEPAKTYIDKRTSIGNSKKEAIRLLRRHLSNEVFKRLLADEKSRRIPSLPALPAQAA